VAHEFTSPLQSMRSAVEYLKRYHNNPEHLRDPLSQFDFIIEEVDFLNYLITNIRSQGLGERTDFLSTSPGPRTTEKLFKIVEKVQTLLKGQARERGLEIKLIGAFPIVKVDKFHLEQVIFNLLVNAIKYTRPNSVKPIEVVCDESSTDVILSFRNWGIGVRSNEATRIFDMFERGSNAYISSVTGTGIGLHISKKIMQTLGGELKLTKLDNPTEFTIYLPKD
jgi:two-component system phosphate regulon sensor histidine kinase PhoR